MTLRHQIGAVKLGVTHHPDLLKAATAGLLAGLVGTWAKGRFQAAWTEAQNAFKRDATPPAGPSQSSPQGSEGQSKKQQSEPSTEKAAEAISRHVLHRGLDERERKFGGKAVDFSFGTATGVAYSLAAELSPEVTAGEGLAFGAALWAFGDELGVPAAGLANWPTEYPASTHAYALCGHLVYGFVAEITRRLVRSALSTSRSVS